MKQEYENAVTSGIERYWHAMAYDRAIFREHAEGKKDVIVLLASDDEEINCDTLLY